VPQLHHPELGEGRRTLTRIAARQLLHSVSLWSARACPRIERRRSVILRLAEESSWSCTHRGPAIPPLRSASVEPTVARRPCELRPLGPLRYRPNEPRRGEKVRAKGEALGGAVADPSARGLKGRHAAASHRGPSLLWSARACPRFRCRRSLIPSWPTIVVIAHASKDDDSSTWLRFARNDGAVFVARVKRIRDGVSPSCNEGDLAATESRA
jgi:hypothetical protein